MIVNKGLEWKASDLEWDRGFISDTWIDGHWAVWSLDWMLFAILEKGHLDKKKEFSKEEEMWWEALEFWNGKETSNFILTQLSTDHETTTLLQKKNYILGWVWEMSWRVYNEIYF